MRCITGDECGLLKETVVAPQRKNSNTTVGVVVKTKDGIRNINQSSMSREIGIVGLTWMNDTSLPKSFAALKIDGSIEIWGVDEDENCDSQPSSRRKIPNYQHIANVAGIFGTTSNNSRPKKCLPKSPHRALEVESLDNNLLCACNASGEVVVVKPFVEEDNCILQQFSAFSNPVATTAFAQSNNKVAVGGRDHEMLIFDLDYTTTSSSTSDNNNNNNNNNNNSPAPIWKAKNLPPNRQTLLAYPVWPTAACFLEPNILAVGTAYHQVRIYDTRISTEAGFIPRRRPIAWSPFESSSYLEYRVTAVCGMSPQQQPAHGLIVGDAAGYIHALDIRKLSGSPASSSADTGRFVGPAGSVRQLAVHSTMPRLVAVGLDRMLRIYDTQTRKQLETVYLKQRLNCVLISEEEGDEDDSNDQDMDKEDDVRDYVDTESEKEEDDSEEGIDDVLEQIDEVQDLEESNSSSSGDDSSHSDDDDVQLRSSKKRGRSDEDDSSDASS
jgi:ribosome biogenesis protein NSA1